MKLTAGKCASVMVVTLACGVAASVACSEPTAIIGGPTGLATAMLPGNNAAGDGAASSDSGVSVDAAPVQCAIDAAGCPSWKATIFPLMKATGAWQCSNPTAGCHAAGQQPPQVTDGDPQATYNALVAFVTVGHPMIAPCVTDPTMSSFECVLGANGTVPCSIPMPQPPGAPPTAAQSTQLDDWIRCGAPFN